MNISRTCQSRKRKMFWVSTSTACDRISVGRDIFSVQKRRCRLSPSKIKAHSKKLLTTVLIPKRLITTVLILKRLIPKRLKNTHSEN